MKSIPIIMLIAILMTFTKQQGYSTLNLCHPSPIIYPESVTILKIPSSIDVTKTMLKVSSSEVMLISDDKFFTTDLKTSWWEPGLNQQEFTNP